MIGSIYNNNLVNFFNKLLISLTVARVSFVFENTTGHIVDTILSTESNKEIKWSFANIDCTFVPPQASEVVAIFEAVESAHLVILAFNGKYTEKWLKASHTFRISQTCNFLVIIYDNVMEASAMNWTVQILRNMGIFFVALLYSHSNGDIEIFAYPAQLPPKSTDYRNTSCLYDKIFSDQYSNFNGEPLLIFSTLMAPNLFLGRLRNSNETNFMTEDYKVGGSYVYIASMIGRYFNATVSLATQDLWQDIDHKDDIAYIQYLEKYVRKEQVCEEVLGHNNYF